MKGKTSWLEIGTETKLNLAYMSTILSEDALVIDIDIAKNEEGTKKLKDFAAFQLHQIINSSNNVDTVRATQKILNNKKIDGIFIDGNHMYEFVFNDFVYYNKFVKDNGYIFFHDIFYTGNQKSKGVFQCLDYINRWIPVYQVYGNAPVSRFKPMPNNDIIWGGVAIIRMKDLLAYKYKLQAQQ